MTEITYTQKNTRYSLKHTAFFPLTGNPIGFHHMILAECVLRQFPDIHKVVFILSNGMHPDPHKFKQILPKEQRLGLLEKMILEFHLPSHSVPAQHCIDHQDTIQLTPDKAEVCLIEFEHEHVFRIVNHLDYIQSLASIGPDSHPIQLILGADLLHRMLDPEIFSDADLDSLSKQCQLLILNRNNIEVLQALQAVQQQRSVDLQGNALNIENVPSYLQPFLSFSSTLIRRNIQSYHEVESFLPKGACAQEGVLDWYRSVKSTLEANEWEMECWYLQKKLEQKTRELFKLLKEFQAQGRPHRLAFVETSTGGRMAGAFTLWQGASQFFCEGRVMYANEAKQQLLQQDISGPTVSAQMAKSLAQAAQKQNQADFVLAETGMAGPPDPHRHSQKNGQSYFALVTPNGTFEHFHQSHVFLNKKEHQLDFGIHALDWMIQTLKQL